MQVRSELAIAVMIMSQLGCSCEPPPSPGPASPPAPSSAQTAWYEVVAESPGPQLTDETMRERIVASGRPWKVRDRATGIEMVLVMPGEFLMGSPASEAGHNHHEGPQHRVRISRGFYLGSTEVTQATWTQLMGPEPSFFPGPELPIDPSWEAAQDFVARANAALPESAEPMRLPTEAEWEYAARAGSQGPFSFGETIEGPARHAWMNFNDGEVKAAKVVDGRLEVEWVTPPSPECRMRTAPAGSLPPNAWGLHEMHGNSWEWTADDYQPDAYAGRGELTVDPFVKVLGSELHALRGGSWYDDATECRAAARDAGGTDTRSNRIGFRVARSVAAR